MKRTAAVDVVRVTRVPGQPCRAKLIAAGTTLPCAIGPAGIVHRKREGDGATPAGRFRVLRGLYRGDRVGRPPTALPMRAVRRDDGICDDPRAPVYNRFVHLPVPWSHETLWRTDAVYDVVLVVDHNLAPRVRGHGSAIFFHVARPDFSPTAGCVAISAAAMRKLLPRLSRRTVLVIG